MEDMFMKKRARVLVCSLWYILLVFGFSGCSYKLIVHIKPSDAVLFLDSKPIQIDEPLTVPWPGAEHHLRAELKGYHTLEQHIKLSLFQLNEYSLVLEPELYRVTINIDEGESELYLGDLFLGKTPIAVDLPYGVNIIRMHRDGYIDELCRLQVEGSTSYLFHHHQEGTPFEQLGIFPTGKQPKQVIFSPDEQYVTIPLLDDVGFNVFDIPTLTMLKKEEIPRTGRKLGFAEGLFITDDQVSSKETRFFISQMTTGTIFEYAYPAFTFKRSFPTGGNWSKFMAWESRSRLLAISNWLSDTVSIINIDNGQVLKLLATDPVPRGLVFTHDGRYLIVTTYDGGSLLLFNTETWSQEKRLKVPHANLRHVVISPDDKSLYVSDMGLNAVYQVALESFSIIHTYTVDHNPNTIDLSPDGRILIVSCRGPNNPQSYLLRSPRSGIISVIDVQQQKELWNFSAGNQPTGLDISPGGNFLALTNFMDNSLELFWIGDFLKNTARKTSLH
ncbi:MAG: hypothetical protein AB1404_01655 [Spirochaetota bacterium]